MRLPRRQSPATALADDSRESTNKTSSAAAAAAAVNPADVKVKRRLIPRAHAWMMSSVTALRSCCAWGPARARFGVLRHRYVKVFICNI